MASRDRIGEAEECKAQGNKALQVKDFDKAIEWYTQALKLHKDHIYYSNRSAAYLSKGFGDSALKDAEECIQMKPEWSKGYGRKGAALHKLHKYEEALAAYNKGLELDPSNASLQQGIKDVNEAQSGGGGGMGSMFGPDFMDKIAASPKLSKYLSDQSYVSMLNMIQQNPQMLQYAAQDPRIQETFQEILGINFRNESEDAAQSSKNKEDEKIRKEAKEAADLKRKEDEERMKRENETPEEKQARANRESAQKLKEEGNAHYKKREFDQALECYEKALTADPDDMTYLLNISAVKLEMKDLEGSVTAVEEAIVLGRSKYAPYEQIAKAYTRLGNAYFKHKQWLKAKKAYEEAQLECKTSDVAEKLKKIEKVMKKEEANQYVNPELGKEAKEKGNELFKSGKFPESIVAYSDAVKRDPVNPVYYGNRAAAYMKVADFGRAMEDCNKSLELDPKYIKMYARKGNIEFFLKEYHKALDTYQKGIELDSNNEECKQGLAKTRYAVQTSQGENNQERASRAMEDPEIRNIMNDPVMTTVLREMSENPGSAQKHMSNPEIAGKIEKLIAAGVIQTR